VPDKNFIRREVKINYIIQSCGYCGKENDDASGLCVGCGCSLNEPKVSFSFPWSLLLSWGGLIFNIFINGCIVYGSLPVFFRHDNLGPGTIFYFIGFFEIAVISFLIGFPCAILAIKKNRRRVGWLGIILALTPAPLSLALLKVAML
jgi:hypothetical protein